jgi:hypothetical protein
MVIIVALSSNPKSKIENPKYERLHSPLRSCSLSALCASAVKNNQGSQRTLALSGKLGTEPYFYV